MTRPAIGSGSSALTLPLATATCPPCIFSSSSIVPGARSAIAVAAILGSFGNYMVPIMIGGGGEKKTLRLVAQYADACNLFEQLGPELLRKKLDVLRRHCDAERRDYAAIERTTLGTAWLRLDLLPAGTQPADDE